MFPSNNHVTVRFLEAAIAEKWVRTFMKLLRLVSSMYPTSINSPQYYRSSLPLQDNAKCRCLPSHKGRNEAFPLVWNRGVKGQSSLISFLSLPAICRERVGGWLLLHLILEET